MSALKKKAFVTTHLGSQSDLRIVVELKDGTDPGVENYLKSGTWDQLMYDHPSISSLSIYRELPERLWDSDAAVEEEVLLEKIALSEALNLSPEREKFVIDIVDKIKAYNSSPSRTAFVVTLDGPPGIGKTTLLHEIAIRLYQPVYKPLGISASFIGKTARHISNIFKKLRAENAVLIWNEVDSISSERGSGTTDAAVEGRDVIRQLIEELDTPGAVILCSTNKGKVIDEAIKSRLQKNLFEIPGLNCFDRYECLKLNNKWGASEEEVSDLAAGTYGYSFRDLETLIDKFKERSHNLLQPTIIKATREAAVYRNFGWVWTAPVQNLSTTYKKVKGITNDLTSDVVCVGFENKRARVYRIGENGFLDQKLDFEAEDDVIQAIWDKKYKRISYSMNRGLKIQDNADFEDPDFQSGDLTNFNVISTKDCFFESAFCPYYNNALYAVTKDALHYCVWGEKGFNICGTISIGNKAGRSIKVLSCDPVSKTTLLALGLNSAVVYLLKFEMEKQKFAEIGKLDLSTVDGTSLDIRRLGVFYGDHPYLFSAISGAVSVWRFRNQKFENVSRLKAPVSDSETYFAIDQVTGSVAVAARNRIFLYRNFGDPNAGQDVLEIPENLFITAVSFAYFGRHLVIGTGDGQIFTSSLRKGIRG